MTNNKRVLREDAAGRWAVAVGEGNRGKAEDQQVGRGHRIQDADFEEVMCFGEMEQQETEESEREVEWNEMKRDGRSAAERGGQAMS